MPGGVSFTFAAREMARAPPPQNTNKNLGRIPYHYMPEKRGGNNKRASVSRCTDHDTFKFNCSEPSKENPNRPCGKGCCHHRNPNNRKKFMKRRSCKECKKNGEGGQDLCDLHYVDKRSCKICAPRCEEHGKVKAMCRLCRVEEANAVMNLTSLGAGEREKIQKNDCTTNNKSERRQRRILILPSRGGRVLIRRRRQRRHTPRPSPLKSYRCSKRRKR